MDMLGIHLTILIGPTVALPAPAPLTQAVQSVEVTHSDEGRSAFQMTFQVGRSGPLDLLDYPLVSNPLLRPFNRVVLIVTFNAMPQVLMDGVITHHQLSPGDQPGRATFTITGEDLTKMMDMKEVSAQHPAQPEFVVANVLIASYAQFGMVPLVLPPPSVSVPVPTDRIPTQQNTDYKHLVALAAAYGYVFYLIPGPAPMTSLAYWGPPIRAGFPQGALTTNMGPESNVTSIHFQNNANAPATVAGRVQDRMTNTAIPVQTFAAARPPLSVQPSTLVNQPNVRQEAFRVSAVDATQAFAEAQGRTDAASDSVSADGELDALRYGRLLSPRALVGLRGVGFSYDGLYYVKKVTHSIKHGEYKQKFSLTRDGTGATTPVVPT